MGNQKLRAAMAVFNEENSEARQKLKTYTALKAFKHGGRVYRAEHLTEFFQLLRNKSDEEFKGGEARPQLGRDEDSYFDCKSGLSAPDTPGLEQDDEKRHEQKIRQLMQVGFESLEKKIETLKQADFKHLVLPSNKSALAYERIMQARIAIHIAAFHMQKGVKRGPKFQFEDMVNETVQNQVRAGLVEVRPWLPSDSTLRMMRSRVGTLRCKVIELVEQLSSRNALMGEWFESEGSNFTSQLFFDRSLARLRQIVLEANKLDMTGELSQRAADDIDRELLEPSVKLLFLLGLAAASPEDLLIACRLQLKYKIDLSQYLSSLCDVASFQDSVDYEQDFAGASQGSEQIFKTIDNAVSIDDDSSSEDEHELGEVSGQAERCGKFEVVNRQMIQNDHLIILRKGSRTEGSKNIKIQDKIVTDGEHYFIASQQHGVLRAKKDPSTGNFRCENIVSPEKYPACQLLCHKDMLLIRHKNASQMPFQVMDKSLMRVDTKYVVKMSPNQTSQKDSLAWTPEGIQCQSNARSGNRWVRNIPFCSDGRLIYCLVPYKQTDIRSLTIKIVCEVYEIKKQESTMSFQLSRVREVTLYKNRELDYFTGRSEDPSYLCFGSLASDGESLVWRSRKNLHVFSLDTGVKLYKEKIPATVWISTYDPTDNFFYHTSHMCYFGLERFKLKGFDKAGGSLKKLKKRKNPEGTRSSSQIALLQMPALFGQLKQRILDQNNQEASVQKEFARVQFVNQAASLFPKLSAGKNLWTDEDELVLERPRATEPLEDVHSVTQALVLSFLGTKALDSVKELSTFFNQMKNMQVVAEDFCQKAYTHFRMPFCGVISANYLVLLRQNMHSQLLELREAGDHIRANYAHYIVLRTEVMSKSLINRQQRAADAQQELTKMIEDVEARLSNALNSIFLFQTALDKLSVLQLDLSRFMSEQECEAIQQSILPELKLIMNKKIVEIQQQNVTETMRQLEVHVCRAASRLYATLLTKDQFGKPKQLLAQVVELVQQLTRKSGAREREGHNVKSKLLEIEKYAQKDRLQSILAGKDTELYTQVKLIIKMCLEFIGARLCEPVRDGQGSQEMSARQAIEIVVHFTEQLLQAYGRQLQSVLDLKQEIKDKDSPARQDVLRAEQSKLEVHEGIFLELFTELVDRFNRSLDILVHSVEAQTTPEDFKRKTRWLVRLIKKFIIVVCLHESCESQILPLSQVLQLLAQAVGKCRVTNSANEAVFPGAQELDRQVGYAVGVVAYRLIQVPEHVQSNLIKRLNILQGGIEQRFFCVLSEQTQRRIEEAYEISRDEQLRTLGIIGAGTEEKTFYKREDTILRSVIDNEEIQPSVELVLRVLQQALLMRMPSARVGGIKGEHLTRAAFAVLVKFSLNMQSFQDLSLKLQSVDVEGAEGDQKVRKLVQELKRKDDADFNTMLKQWEQASLMRKWTQNIKRVISERLEPQLRQKMREECNVTGKLFAPEKNFEQKEELERRLFQKLDLEVQQTYEQVVEKARFLVKLAVPQILIEAKLKKEQEQVDKVSHEESKQAPSTQVDRLSMRKSRIEVMAQKRVMIDTRVSRASLMLPDGSQMERTSMKRLNQRFGAILLRDDRLSKRDSSEPEWKERIRQWKSAQMAQRAANDLTDQSLEVLQNCTFSVLGCLQAEFTCKELKQTVELILESGLRRSVGLHLIKSSLNLPFARVHFFDMLQWFNGALRQNKMSGTAHYLTGLEGCSSVVRKCMQVSFSEIIATVLSVLRHEDISDLNDYVFLVNSLCWSYSSEDHEWLSQLKLAQALLMGNGDILHPLRQMWGRTDLLYGLKLSDDLAVEQARLCLPSYLWQTFSFYVSNLLESIFVRQEREQIQHGSETSQTAMTTGEISKNQQASEDLLKEVSTVLFATLDRYIKMQELGHSRHDDEFGSRFSKPGQSAQETYQEGVMSDVLEFFKQEGGHEKCLAEHKIKRNLQQRKVELYMHKLGQLEDLSAEFQQKTIELAQGHLWTDQRLSFKEAKTRILNHSISALSRIKEQTWEDLNLDEPVLDLFQKSTISGYNFTQDEQLIPESLSGFRTVGSISLMESQGDIYRDSFCETPGLTPDESGADLWMCQNCEFGNEQMATECLFCQTARPEEEPAQEVFQDKEDAFDEQNQEEKNDNKRILLQVPTNRFRKQMDHQEKELCAIGSLNQKFNSWKANITRACQSKKSMTFSQNFSVGIAFSEIALFQVAGMLELMVSLVDEACEGFQIMTDFSHPYYLSQLIQIATNSTTQNQILMHKIIQSLIKLELPKECFEQAVSKAKHHNVHVKSILAHRPLLSFKQNQFLQLLCNQVQVCKEYLYKTASHDESCQQLHVVGSEIARTLGQILSVGGGPANLRIELKSALQQVLLNIKAGSFAELDTVFSILPEMQIQSVCIGSPCINAKGDSMTILGFADKDEVSLPLQQVTLSYTSFHRSLTYVYGLYFDAENPEQQDVLLEKLSQVTATMSLDPFKTEALMKNSLVFSDPNILRIALEVAFERDHASYQQFVLQNFLMRGANHMLQQNAKGFMTFLKQHDLLVTLIDYLQEKTETRPQTIESQGLLELKLDLIRQQALSTPCCTLGAADSSSQIGENADGGSRLHCMAFSSPKCDQLYVTKKSQTGAVDYFYYRVKCVLGKQLQNIKGPLVDVTGDEQDLIYVIESKRLQNPTLALLKVLARAKIVITDQEANIDFIMKRMKFELTREANKELYEFGASLDSVFPDSLVIIESDLSQLKRVVHAGSKVANRDKKNRGYLLQEIMSKLDESIWQKLSPDFFIKKFTELDAKYSNLELIEQHARKLIEGVITANYDTDRKLLKKNQQLATKTFEMIRQHLLEPGFAKDPAASARRINNRVSKTLQQLQASPLQIKEGPLLNQASSQQMVDDSLASFSNLQPAPVDDSHELRMESDLEAFYQQVARQRRNDPTRYKQISLDLVDSYSTQILLKSFSEAPSSFLSAASLSEQTIQRVLQLIRDELTVSQILSKQFGDRHRMAEVKYQIKRICLQLKREGSPFVSHFVQDIVDRMTWLAQNLSQNFDQIGTIKSQSFVNPHNIEFFTDLILHEELVFGDSKARLAKHFYEMALIIAFKYHSVDEFRVSRLMLKLASKLLKTQVRSQIDKLRGLSDQNNQPVLAALFSNPLLKQFFQQRDLKHYVSEGGRELLVIVQELTELSKEVNQKIEIEVSDEIRRSLKAIKRIELGLRNQKFEFKTKLKALVKGKDNSKVSHLATMYATSVPMHCQVRFFKQFRAPPGQDYEIEFENFASNHFVQVKTDSGETFLHNQQTLRQASDKSIFVPAGTQVSIEFPVQNSFSALYTGWLQLTDNDDANGDMHNLNSYSWTQIVAAINLSANRVLACGKAVMFVTDSESVWGMGKKVQGSQADERTLTRLQTPPGCKNFAKIIQTRYYRLILTQDYKLFFSGHNMSYLFGYDLEVEQQRSAFTELRQAELFVLQPGEHVVEIAAGKNFVFALTSTGQLVAKGAPLYGALKNRLVGAEEDLAFTVLLPEGQESFHSIHAAQNSEAIWVTCKDAAGNLKTFGAGKKSSLIGKRADDNDENMLVPLDLPAGTYLVKVDCWDREVFGIDQNGGLWVWGMHLDAQEWERDLIFESPANLHLPGKPLKLKLIAQEGQKVVDISCGKLVTLVKAQNVQQTGQVHFYAVINQVKGRSEEDILSYMRIVGLESMADCFGNYVKQLSVDSSQVQSFAVGATTAFMIMQQQSKQTVSMVPDQPDAHGLVHFYQVEETKVNEQGESQPVKKWVYVTEEQYEMEKESLPAIVYATRHPIEKLADLSRKIGYGNATEAELNENVLPSLADAEEAAGLVQMSEEVKEHELACTATGERLSADQPLYYCRYKDGAEADQDEQSSTIVASEQELFQGGQTWDLKPLIFYRVSRPARSLHTLPTIDLDQYYPRRRGDESQAVPDLDGQISFLIKRKQIKWRDIEHIELTDSSMGKVLQQFQSFTHDQDRQILETLDKQIAELFGEKADLSRLDMRCFDISKDQFKQESSLQALQSDAITMRAELLLSLSKAFSEVFKLIDPKSRGIEGTISHKHFSLKNHVLPSIINSLVDTSLKDLREGVFVEVQINRRVAKEFADANKVDYEGKSSIYGQIVTQLQAKAPDMNNFRKHGLEAKCFKVKLMGEGSIDAGGPFRDTLTNIVQELESGVVPILVKTPNNRLNQGEYFMLNQNATSPGQLLMLKFLGAFIAFALISKQPFALNLAPAVWKQILGEQLDLASLSDIDSNIVELLRNMEVKSKQMPDEEFEAAFDQNFTTILSNGDQYNLKSNGENIMVNSTNLLEYRDLVLKARSAECLKQVQAVQEGLEKVLEGKMDYVSYLSAQAIDIRVCGKKAIEVEQLKAVTEYPNAEEGDATIQRFWRVFDGFSQEDRSLYLKFVWGRTRMPIGECTQKHKVKVIRDWVQTALPQSHTCFFTLDLPPFECDDVCREKILYAIHSCGNIDTDNNNFAE